MFLQLLAHPQAYGFRNSTESVFALFFAYPSHMQAPSDGVDSMQLLSVVRPAQVEARAVARLLQEGLRHSRTSSRSLSGSSSC